MTNGETTQRAARAAADAVDEARLWQRLMDMAQHGATPRGGVNRQALSKEDAAARQTFVAWGREQGLTPYTDAIGNLFLRRAGRDEDAAPVVVGSHLDSQPMGGKFDGAYGVLAGFEALEAMNLAGVETRRPIEVVAWLNEEGSRFQPGIMGSATFSGRMKLEDLLGLTDRDGVTVEAALKDFLAATPEVEERPLGFPLGAYIEGHIEQGPLLEHAGKPVGIVRRVQGLRWFAIEILGEAAHAGTTPLRLRKDALKAATAMIAALEQAMDDPEDVVRFTVGRFEVEPGAPNTVPARVFFTIDLRHPEAEVLDRLTAEIQRICREQARGCEVKVEQTSDTPPTVFDPAVADCLDRWRATLGFEGLDMVSGAGHDAMCIAPLCPTAMLFVPCEKGISHNESENAEPGDLAAGARVMTAALVELADR